MLRISWPESNGTSAAVRIEGAIAGAHVLELARFTAQALERSPRVVLDLEDVTFVDHAGAALLRALRDQGVVLVGGSSFISGLISPPADGPGGGGGR